MLRLSSFGKVLPEDQREYVEISRELYDRIWRPIEEHVVDRDLVLIAPDDALNLVSFAGLMDRDSTYLIEKSTIHYLTCGRDLMRLKERSKIGSGLLAFGDPDFDAAASARLQDSHRPEDSVGSAGYHATRNVRSGCVELAQTRLSPLPETRDEVEQILAHWQQATDERAVAYFDSDASEEKFKREAPGYRVIHLATHGYFLTGECRPESPDTMSESARGDFDENPLLLSGLFVAGANLHGADADSSGAEDGVLTAYEVSALDLEGTDLVVLSACETALGEIDAGEGVYGLRRAFQMAGARTVVSALWPISDKATSETLSRLYEETGHTVPEQLRTLQLERIRALREAGELDHPVRWAAFIAIGAWE
jgi:CHAT domain-containing protein